MRILVGGVGYTNLQDMSVGPRIVQELRRLSLPGHVEVDDLNHLVASYQRLSQEGYDRLILVSAVRRGRMPGSVEVYRYDPEGGQPAVEDLRSRVGEGVAGTVDIDSLLALCRYYKALPPDVLVIEVEPQSDTWGEAFSPAVEEAVRKVLVRIMNIVNSHEMQEATHVQSSD